MGDSNGHFTHSSWEDGFVPCSIWVESGRRFSQSLGWGDCLSSVPKSALHGSPPPIGPMAVASGEHSPLAFLGPLCQPGS